VVSFFECVFLSLILVFLQFTSLEGVLVEECGAESYFGVIVVASKSLMR